MGKVTSLRAAAVGALVAVVTLAVWASPASAAPPAADGGVTTVELIPADGTSFVVGDRTYQGTLRIGSGAGGLVLTEQVTLDQYLSGIREVPFSWPAETLAAQVVAARTYLAYTLAAGRSGAGAERGYDICASSACQVYAGSGLVAQEGGERWVAAVERTARQILIFEGRPAQTVYSSATGTRTRANQDIWGGAPLPYLQPVDSPEEDVSPFDSWTIDVDPALFVRILARDGYDVSGDLESILVRAPNEGEGPTTIWVDTTGGTDVVAETDLKGAFNRHGPTLAPGVLPTRTGDGRLPQALPSYTYDIAFDVGADPALVAGVADLLPREDVPEVGSVVIEGEGWGHGVGMSQWGAKAMGDAGETYDAILAHYYGGLIPVDGGEYVPEDLVVGLGWDLDGVDVTIGGGFELRAGGVTVAVLPGGEWSFRRGSGGLLDIVPPAEVEGDLSSLLGGGHWPR